MGRQSLAAQLGFEVIREQRPDGRWDVRVVDDEGTVKFERDAASRDACLTAVHSWIIKEYPDYDFDRPAPRQPRDPNAAPRQRRQARPATLAQGDASTATVAAELSRRADRCDRLAEAKRAQIEKVTKDLIAEAEHLEREAIGFRQAASLLAEVD